MQLIECVPNFSEGVRGDVIDAIADALRSTNGIYLLHIDKGVSANRTVMTFVGEPEAILEGAFASISKAAQLIDMREQKGVHPRIGATDVFPFIPLLNIEMDECVKLSKRLAQRVGEELNIPVYLYEESASSPERTKLADIRKGNYEKLEERVKQGFLPDFGPKGFNAKGGATVIGARKFLVAYNINLNTEDQDFAQEIALNIRERGRLKKDQDGETTHVASALKGVNAIGWFASEYERAQVSTNITDLETAGIHEVFLEVSRQAALLELEVTGSEIVGMVPLSGLAAAGQYFALQERFNSILPMAQLIELAIERLGLDELNVFDPKKKILELALIEANESLRDFFWADSD